LAVIAVATVAFVIGTVIERNSGESHEAKNATESLAHKTGGEARETAEAQTSRPRGTSDQAAAEPTSEHAGKPSELTPLGIDIEAAPFVALAAIASLALAIATWLRPRTVPLLGLVALAMLVFAALDIQEVVHQSHEARTGLAILAACVAALHLIAAALATVMIRDARRPDPGRPAAAAQSPA
jgi:hypothetical protein